MTRIIACLVVILVGVPVFSQDMAEQNQKLQQQIVKLQKQILQQQLQNQKLQQQLETLRKKQETEARIFSDLRVDTASVFGGLSHSITESGPGTLRKIRWAGAGSITLDIALDFQIPINIFLDPISSKPFLVSDSNPETTDDNVYEVELGSPISFTESLNITFTNNSTNQTIPIVVVYTKSVTRK